MRQYLLGAVGYRDVPLTRPANRTKSETPSIELPDLSSYASVTFATKDFMFVPNDVWDTPTVNFRDMCISHFRGKSNKKVKFEHKLWNALQITRKLPTMYPVVGVMWLDESVIQVNRTCFGGLLNLGKSTSALFNAQGSFPTHGFVELSLRELEVLGVRPYSCDYDDCRFFHRPDGLFTTESTEECLSKCSYVKPDMVVAATPPPTSLGMILRGGSETGIMNVSRRLPSLVAPVIRKPGTGIQVGEQQMQGNEMSMYRAEAIAGTPVAIVQRPYGLFSMVSAEGTATGCTFWWPL